MGKFTVTNEDQKQRLDLFLKFNLQKYSRSSVRKLLDQGRVQLNDEVEYRPNYKVQEGDVLVVDTDGAIAREYLLPYEREINIVYQDEHILVVNKPVGLKVHPVGSNDKQSLLNAIHYMLEGNLTDYGVTLINRIDKATSGLVMMALSAKGAWHYSREFAKSRANKYYLAAVFGQWVNKYQDSEIDVHNFLDYDHVTRQQRVNKEKGEFAHTKFRLVDVNHKHNYSLLSAKPITGRTHQIRAHLAYIGFPILGDKKYAGPDFDRLMLHSYRLRIKGLGGNVQTFEAPVPKEFSSLFSQVDHEPEK